MQNIKLKSKIITLCFIILMLSFVNITFNMGETSALSYQSEVGIGFTFNPTLSINISSPDLVISNLVPGSSSDSNTINVSVLTNASHGYTLAVDTSSEDLVHSNNINTFSSIATDADLASLTTDNTWGYSYKLANSDNNAWSNYNGLPLHTNTSTTLINTDNQISKPIDFKIGAKAGSTQASGTYTGTINFIAVSKPTPKTIDDIVYMQTFGELVSTDLQSVKNSMLKNTTYTLKDARDEQEYTVAKLEDNKIWMTKNLNLAGGTEITSELSDVPENYTLPTEDGFQEGNKLPAPSRGFGGNTQAYAYNTGNNTNDCGTLTGCYSYYSWTAATAGSGVNITANGTDAAYSICPKGWKLPTGQNYGYTGTKSDYYQLVEPYTTQGNTFYNQAGPGTIPDFLLVGIYSNYNFYSGSARYWSSTSAGSNSASALYFDSSSSTSYNSRDRRYGCAVRCLAR